MELKSTKKLSISLRNAHDEAIRTGYRAVGADHLMLGLLRQGDNSATRILSELGIDIKELKKEIDSRIFRKEAISYNELEKIPLSKVAKSVFQSAVYDSLRYESEYTGCAHLLMAIVESNQCASSEIISSLLEAPYLIRIEAERMQLVQIKNAPHAIEDERKKKTQMIADAMELEIRRRVREGLFRNDPTSFS